MTAAREPKHGDVLDVRCQRLEGDGLGVAALPHHDLLIRGALPGARVRVRVEHVSPHRSRDRAKAWGAVVEVIEASVDAREPFCPAFGTCGGCTWQHLAYEQQLHWKRRLVQEALQAHGVTTSPTACVASPKREAYRNQGKYVVDAHSGGLRLGGYAPRSHDVVDLTKCRLVETAVAEAITAVKTQLGPLAPCTRHVVVRANEAGEALVTLVVADGSFARGREAARFAATLMDASPVVVGVVANINATAGDVIFGQDEVVLTGQGHLDDQIAGARVRLSPRAFFQVNRHVAALAYLDIAAFAEQVGNTQVVWDVYAGVGTIAKVLQHALPRLQAALCIEIRAAAVADAQALAPRGDARLTFIAGSADRALPSSAEKPDLVVLNPPRAGCDARVLERVAAARPRGIAYLSCNPGTLARDMATLAARGFVAARVTPFDMLPHTPHVETLALLQPA